MAESRTTVYTDGACSGNPGPGGWAWVVPDGPHRHGGEPETTNQRMELTAVLDAVRSLEGPLHVVSDSTYVVNCFRDGWWRGWLKRGWKNSQKKPVANRDLWEPLIDLHQARDLTFEWVKGHSGDRWNDRADELAVLGRDEAMGVTGPAGDVHNGEDSADLPHRIAVVGHRPPELGGYEENPIVADLRRRVGDILEAKSAMFPGLQVLTGLQLGAETVAAEAAIAAGVDFVAVLAFPDPASRWPKPAQQRFDELLDQAVDVVIVDTAVPRTAAEAGKAFGRRDRWLQDQADEAIVVFDGAHRGVGAQLRAFERALGEDVWVLEPIDG